MATSWEIQASIRGLESESHLLSQPKIMNHSRDPATFQQLSAMAHKELHRCKGRDAAVHKALQSVFKITIGGSSMQKQQYEQHVSWDVTHL